MREGNEGQIKIFMLFDENQPIDDTLNGQKSRELKNASRRPQAQIKQEKDIKKLTTLTKI